MTLGAGMPVRCHVMTGQGPGERPEDPFGGIPFLGDLMKMLGAQGGFRWDQAVQIAIQLATEGRSEDNPDPLERIALEQLARVAELQVARVTGLPTSTTGRPVTVVPVTRAMWIHRSADAYRPLFEQLAASLAGPRDAEAAIDPELAGDPMAAMWGNMVDALAPMMLSMTAGSMVGHLARRSLGQYDLPIPRPPSDELVIVSANLAEFGEQWSLPVDDLRMWVCLHEVAHHTVLGVPHIGEALSSMLAEFAAGFTADARGLGDRLGDVSLDDPSSLAALQETFGDPQVLLGAMRSDAQRELLPRLEALVTTVVGVVDWVMDQVGGSIIGSYGQLSEALRRRRVEADASDRFVEQLLGLELTQASYDRGSAFVEGVVERAGAEGVERLWTSARNLPTPNELDAPGLWLARIDLPDEPAS
jgi:putative hydrolase